MRVAPELAKLGHVALVTPDIERSFNFFHDVLGLEESGRRGDTIFLRAWGDFEHHSLSLTPGPEAYIEHVAWRAKRSEDVEGFARAACAKRAWPSRPLRPARKKRRDRRFASTFPAAIPSRSITKCKRRCRRQGSARGFAIRRLASSRPRHFAAAD